MAASVALKQWKHWSGRFYFDLHAAFWEMYSPFIYCRKEYDFRQKFLFLLAGIRRPPRVPLSMLPTIWRREKS